MAASLESEIRTLRDRFWSGRDPDGRAFAPLADAYRRAGEFDRALELLQDGLERLPGFTPGHVVAAWVHRDRADLVAAEGSFRRVLELDPENARALHGLGQLLARGGRLALGRGLVVRAAELDPVLEREEGAAPLAPLPEPAVDVAVLAPEAAVDIRTLAPAGEAGVLGDPDGRGPIVEIGSLAPSEDRVWTIASAAGVEAAGAGPVVEIADLAPDASVEPLDRMQESAAREGTEPEPMAEGAAAPLRTVYTRTMADLLARQGLVERALEIYRHLAREQPLDPHLGERVAELEERMAHGTRGRGSTGRNE